VTQYYRIQPDLDAFPPFKLDNFDFLNKLGDKLELSDFGKPVKNDWKPVKGTYVINAYTSTIPDITTWQTDMLALNQKAYDALKDMLETFGELLPIEVNDETYYLFNVVERLPDDAIDMDNSEYEYYEEEPVGFRILNLDAKNIPEERMIFCVQNDFAYNLYCDDRFIKLLEEKGLKGLHFNTTLIDPYFKK
jgi:hypothetical protein